MLRFGIQKLKDFSDTTGANIEIIQNEFVVNGRGDILQAPLSCKTINGYNIVNTHLYKLAKGETPTQGMARQINRMGDLSRKIHIANMAHLHIFGVSVIDNKLYNITGSGAGQCVFDQNYGLASKPLFEIHRFMPDGRFVINTIGTEFLKDYKIQNPEVKAIGLDNFIRKCLEEEAGIYAFGDEPKDIQKVYQRQLVIGKPPRVIGTKVD